MPHSIPKAMRRLEGVVGVVLLVLLVVLALRPSGRIHGFWPRALSQEQLTLVEGAIVRLGFETRFERAWRNDLRAVGFASEESPVTVHYFHPIGRSTRSDADTLDGLRIYVRQETATDAHFDSVRRALADRLHATLVETPFVESAGPFETDPWATRD